MQRSIAEPRDYSEALRNLLARSVMAGTSRRDVSSSISDVKTSFSSWDNCMKATYCKYVPPHRDSLMIMSQEHTDIPFCSDGQSSPSSLSAVSSSSPLSGALLVASAVASPAAANAATA